MSEGAGHDSTWLEIPVNGWKWLEIDIKDYKGLEVAGHCWILLELLEWL